MFTSCFAPRRIPPITFTTAASYGAFPPVYLIAFGFFLSLFGCILAIAFYFVSILWHFLQALASVAAARP